MKCYRQLNGKDRKKIARLKSYKLSISEIARRTGFNKSTISRELKRNGWLQRPDDKFWIGVYLHTGLVDAAKELLKKPTKETLRYMAKYAIRDANIKRRRSVSHKRIPTHVDKWIRKRLLEDWTPEHVAGRSVFECERKVSHEYVYNLIAKDRKEGGILYKKLKRFGKRKQRLGSRQYNIARIPKRTPIAKRPKIVNSRKRAGDLEGDLIVGYKQSGYILTVIDRRSRLVALEYLKTRKSEQVRQAFLRAFKRMPKLKTLTLDNAREFSCHTDLTRETKIKVYFADPYASHQRGSVENINGWIRYYYPKRTDFSDLDRRRLRRIENLLNRRPRKVLGYLTPEELAFR